MPQPDWYNETVYEHVKQLSLYVNPLYVVFAPWALSDEYIRLIGGKFLLLLFLFQFQQRFIHHKMKAKNIKE